MKIDPNHLHMLAAIIYTGGLGEGASAFNKSQPSVLAKYLLTWDDPSRGNLNSVLNRIFFGLLRRYEPQASDCGFLHSWMVKR